MSVIEVSQHEPSRGWSGASERLSRAEVLSRGLAVDRRRLAASELPGIPCSIPPALFLALLGARPHDSVRGFLLTGLIREPEEVARQVADAVREERFLILTDPIAQDWIERKALDNERRLHEICRLQAKINAAVPQTVCGANL